MRITGSIFGFIRGRLKTWGATRIRKKLWNEEFASGRWDYLEETSNDCIYGYIEKYCVYGSILDLGCGSGNTGNELNFEKYRDYTGVDVSDVAVQKAVARTTRNGRSKKNHYVASDFGSYLPPQSYDVILFRESIWYIPHRKLKDVLERYRQYLKDSGVFIVRMYDREALGYISALIKANYHVLEQHSPADSKDIVMVFR